VIVTLHMCQLLSSLMVMFCNHTVIFGETMHGVTWNVNFRRRYYHESEGRKTLLEDPGI